MKKRTLSKSVLTLALGMSLAAAGAFAGRRGSRRCR